MASDGVRFVDLTALHASIEAELRNAYSRVLSSSGFTLGHETEAFERDFALYCQTTHCVGVNSGTAALGLMFFAAGIGPGDEVIVPAHTFIASALGVLHAGATPVFCDVLDSTGLIDPDAAAAAITSRTAAVLPVHLYGQVCDMVAINNLASRHGLAVFEDAAQAHGAMMDGRRAGSFGRAAAFSFYPSKNLGALGDGGAITTNDGELAERLRALRNLGQRAKGEHVMIGFNERLDGLQAAFLRAKLPHLDAWNDARRAIASEYRARLEDCVRLTDVTGAPSNVHHLFPIRIPDRERLAVFLEEAGISTGIHYSPAVHRQPPFLGQTGGSVIPVAERWAEEELSLPMHPTLPVDDVAYVCDKIRSYYG